MWRPLGPCTTDPPALPPFAKREDMGYRGRGSVPRDGTLRMTSLNRPAPWPPVPRAKMEMITGKLHLGTYCRQEAEREYEASLRGEDYQFQTPETDAGGYLTSSLSRRPVAPTPKEPPPIKG